MNPKCLFLLLLAACSSCSSPEQQRGRPEVSISVLVDLSETWHNTRSGEINRRLLGNIGRAIDGAAVNLPKPLAVRFHAIGANSLGRAPVCAANFRPSAFSIGEPPEGTIRDRADFQRYVAVDCPEMFLSRPPEPATEISAAIVSAVRATALLLPSASRTFIVLSDFKEEALVGADLGTVNLERAHFILVHRTLLEDQRSPVDQQARLAEWRRRLTARGADVSIIDENAILSSLPDFQALIGLTNAS